MNRNRTICYVFRLDERGIQKVRGNGLYGPAQAKSGSAISHSHVAAVGVQGSSKVLGTRQPKEESENGSKGTIHDA